MTTLTFDELMDRLHPLICKALDDEAAKLELVEHLRTNILDGVFSEDKLQRASEVLANELMSRYQTTVEFGATFSDHGDIDQYTGDPPDAVAVQVRVPGTTEEAIAYAKR